MTAVDDRIRQLVREMADTAPAAGPVPLIGASPAVSRRRTAPLVLTAVVVLLAGAGAALWFVRDDGSSETLAADLADPSRDDDGRLILGPDEWLVPEFLPDSVELAYGLAGEPTGSLFFADPGGPAAVTIGFAPSAAFAPGAPPDLRELGGRTWDRLGDQRYALETTEGWIVVTSIALDDEVLEQVIRSLVIRPTSALSRQPIDVEQGPYVEVARTSFDGRSVTLEVTGDGAVYASRVDSGSSCCLSLGKGELLRVSATGPSPAGEALAYGIVDEAVGLIELYPASGPVIRVEPQDLDGGLPVDFFVASFPTTSEVLRGPLPVIVVYDTDGEELGRSDLDEAVVRRE